MRRRRPLELARRAEEADPDDPHTSDTRGWTRFERDVYQRAADLLGASTTKLPNDPVTGYDTNDDFVTRVNTIGTPG